jgi:hypothetical protein
LQPDLTDSGLWILASAATAIIVTHAAWLARRFLPGQAVGKAQRELAGTLAWLVAALFYALPPILAWRSGALSPYLMGLGEVEWAQSLASGIFLALLAAGALFTAWILGTRRPYPPTERPRPERSQASAWLAPLDATLLQWHWAFYRAGAAGWLLIRGDTLPLADAAILAPFRSAIIADLFYWGSWLGMALIALEWILNPFAREALRDPARRPYHLLRAAIAVASTAVFVATRDFWLALLAGVVVEFAAAVWRPLPQRPLHDRGASGG